MSEPVVAAAPAAAAPAPAPRPGKKKQHRDFGEYRTVKRIGMDALGVLYHAKNTESGEDVALKVIDLERARDRKFA